MKNQTLIHYKNHKFWITTVATSVLQLVHKVISVVLEGLTVPVNCTVFPTFTVSLVGLTARLVIGVITVVEHCAVYPFCAN